MLATELASGRNTPIAVVRAHGEWHVVALQPFAAGERILSIEGALGSRPSQHSIQVDDALHVEVPASELPHLEQVCDSYPWRFLNHSCAPSARIQGREMIAVRGIAMWDELTFDYNTTEDEMTSPFVCRCGHCNGRTIAGFRHLAPAEQERLGPNLAPYLRRRLDPPTS